MNLHEDPKPKKKMARKESLQPRLARCAQYDTTTPLDIEAAMKHNGQNKQLLYKVLS